MAQTTAPILHLNGSSYDDLAAQYGAAIDAVGEALLAVQRIEVNARDYYISQDPTLFGNARHEAVARELSLIAMRNDLVAIRENIETQQDARRRQRSR